MVKIMASDIKIRGLLKKYGLLGSCRLLRDVILTKCFLRQARLIRAPFYIRNVGTLNGAQGMLAGPRLILDILDTDAVLTIGRNLCVNHAVHIAVMMRVTIGDDVLMASGVYISDHSHGAYQGKGQSSPNIPPNLRTIECKPVVIGDNCWLGENVCVLPGVTIGRGVIVGAGAIVVNDIPEYCIVAGIPAKIIKRWDAESLSWNRV
jgi:lipopolysaccharide O-acetyltransferase